MRRTREVCACEAYPPGHETGMVVCWKCAQAVVRVVDDGIGPELVRSWCAHAAGYCICSRWDARPCPVHYPSAARPGLREGTSMSDERVLVDRDDLRAVLPTMKAPDPYFQPAEHDEWLAAFKRVQATLDAGVPVQQDKPDAMPALRDRIAEALWRHDAQIDFPQVGWACEATTYEKTIRRKEADAVLAVLREEGLLP